MEDDYADEIVKKIIINVMGVLLGTIQTNPCGLERFHVPKLEPQFFYA